MNGWPDCMACGRPVDPDSTLTGHESVVISVGRGRGRAIERRETGRVMCPNCATSMEATGTPRQTNLLAALDGSEQLLLVEPPPIAEWPWLR